MQRKNHEQSQRNTTENQRGCHRRYTFKSKVACVFNIKLGFLD